MVQAVESAETCSLDVLTRLADALGLGLEIELTDRKRRDQRPPSRSDPVHSFMGEFEAAHFRRLGRPLSIDEPYQHYQFAGRADVLAWDLAERALLHLENRTRFPDFQDMAGAFNSKRAYLGAVIAKRLGIPRWASETHAIVALWSAEVLHAMRMRTDSFRTICPDDAASFSAWWSGRTPSPGRLSTLVVLDPLASGRQRVFVGLDQALAARPRHRDYAEVANLIARG